MVTKIVSISTTNTIIQVVLVPVSFYRVINLVRSYTNIWLNREITSWTAIDTYRKTEMSIYRKL